MFEARVSGSGWLFQFPEDEPEDERPALEWFCAQTWPVREAPTFALGWAIRNGLVDEDVSHRGWHLTTKGFDLLEANREAADPPKAPPAMFEVCVPWSAWAFHFHEAERPLLEKFLVSTWPLVGILDAGASEMVVWGQNNGFVSVDVVNRVYTLTPKGRDLWGANQKAPVPAPSAALDDFNAWVGVLMDAWGWPVDSIIRYLTSGDIEDESCAMSYVIGLGLATGPGIFLSLTDRGRSALAAGCAHYTSDKVG
jgi:hypothetical protein